MKTKSDAQQIVIGAKRLAKLDGAKIKCRTYGSTTTVNFLTQPTPALIEEIRKLETVKHFGDMMYDTGYFTGQRVQFEFNFEPSAEAMARATEMFKNIGEWNSRAYIKNHHFSENLKTEGPQFLSIVDNAHKFGFWFNS